MAVILAVGLTALVVLILVATVVQILHDEPPLSPEIQLSDNATQILVAAIGGVVGLLGSYMGHRLHGSGSDTDTEVEEPPSAGSLPEPAGTTYQRGASHGR